MSIEVHFSTGTVIDLHAEMRALLEGDRRAVNVMTAVDAAKAEANEPRMTAAQRKAAEKAAKEAEAGAGQAISTGAERVDPETEKQDAKDEAAEKPAEPVKLTHDSVRAMLGGYVQAYGMGAAQEDGAKLIGMAKISEIPDDQAALAKAIIAIGQGIEKNPHKREIAGDGITAEKLAELKPIVTAALAVK